jgi:hypothetical protein
MKLQGDGYVDKRRSIPDSSEKSATTRNFVSNAPQCSTKITFIFLNDVARNDPKQAGNTLTSR